MKTNITIHIGLHKTGTTSIQATLFKNRDKLRKRGVSYFSLNENHSETLYPLFLSEPHLYRQNRLAGIDTPQKAARKNAATERALRRELAKNRSEHFVISGEDISMLPKDAIVRLRDMLTPYAHSIRIVAYVREPIDVITSNVQARLRLGETYEQIVAAPPYPGYGFIRPFIQVFGRAGVDIRIFDPARFTGGDLITDFLSAIGTDPAAARELEIVRTNEAVSTEAALLINEVNKHFLQTARHAPNPGRAANLADLLKTIPGTRFACPVEAVIAAEPLYREDLNWLRETLGGDPFPPQPKCESVSPRWEPESIEALAILINDLARTR
jgi:hypothetical protein